MQQQELDAHAALRENIWSHVFVDPVGPQLIRHGAFPKNWVGKYVSLLERATAVWRDDACWPRDVVSAVHFASLYLDVRYRSWCATSGETNQRTEQNLRTVRAHSERFLMSPLAERRRSGRSQLDLGEAEHDG